MDAIAGAFTAVAGYAPEGPPGTSASRVHGCVVTEWDSKALRDTVTLFTGEEPRLPFHAGTYTSMKITMLSVLESLCRFFTLCGTGAVAGYLPGMTGDALRRALRAQVASGAHAVISTLAQGPATLLSTADTPPHRTDEAVEGFALTSGRR
jgi:hypothetical protein